MNDPFEKWVLYVNTEFSKEQNKIVPHSLAIREILTISS